MLPALEAPKTIECMLGSPAIHSIASGLKRVKDAGEMTPEFLDQARSALEGLALASDDFNEDIHATRAYRENLVRVMTKRAVAKLAGGSR